MRRGMLWREVCIPSRSVTRTPGLPPVARPRSWTSWNSRAVTRAQGATTGARRSTKIFRTQLGSAQKNLRTISTMWTGCPGLANRSVGVESGCEYARRHNHTRDTERWAVWKAELRRAFLLEKNRQPSLDQKGMPTQEWQTCG